MLTARPWLCESSVVHQQSYNQYPSATLQTGRSQFRKLCPTYSWAACHSSVAQTPPPRRALGQHRFAGRQSCRAESSAAPEAPQAEAGSLYNDPALYSAAFSVRNFKQEVSFLLKCFERYCYRPPTSFLELCCGPAKHARLMLSRGLETYAADMNPSMIAYARSKVEDQHKGRFIEADVRNFSLPDSAAVDLAALLLGSLADFPTHDDAISCFKSVHSVLNPDGMLVLELAHPNDIFDGSFLIGEAWDAPQQEGPRLLVEFGGENDDFDPVSQVVSRQISISEHVQPKGYKLLQKFVHQQRIYTMQEVVLMAQLAGLELTASYGDMSSLHIGMSHSVAYRAVLCFQKAAA